MSHEHRTIFITSRRHGCLSGCLYTCISELCISGGCCRFQLDLYPVPSQAILYPLLINREQPGDLLPSLRIAKIWCSRIVIQHPSIPKLISTMSPADGTSNHSTSRAKPKIPTHPLHHRCETTRPPAPARRAVTTTTTTTTPPPEP